MYTRAIRIEYVALLKGIAIQVSITIQNYKKNDFFHFEVYSCHCYFITLLKKIIEVNYSLLYVLTYILRILSIYFELKCNQKCFQKFNRILV